MIKIFSILFLSVFLFPSHGGKKGDVVIINSNKNKSTQNVVAPALVPSKSKKLRSAREGAETDTEDAIIQKLEIERMKDEQKRYNKLFSKGNSSGNTAVASAVNPGLQSSQPFFHNWLNRAFISFGAGSVSYPGAGNINSSDSPAYFFSFGGYGHGSFIFDLSLYYSEHYILPVTGANVNTNVREGVSQPAVSMAVKFSPLKGRIKPYFGVSGSLIARRWFITNKAGGLISDANPDRDIAIKRWRQSVDSGITTGADIGLGNKLGLNINFTYNWNIYTETRDTKVHDFVQVLDKRDSMIVSGNLRYYF